LSNCKVVGDASISDDVHDHEANECEGDMRTYITSSINNFINTPPTVNLSTDSKTRKYSNKSNGNSTSVRGTLSALLHWVMNKSNTYKLCALYIPLLILMCAIYYFIIINILYIIQNSLIASLNNSIQSNTNTNMMSVRQYNWDRTCVSENMRYLLVILTNNVILNILLFSSFVIFIAYYYYQAVKSCLLFIYTLFDHDIMS
jgi:hypothetical protein